MCCKCLAWQLGLKSYKCTKQNKTIPRLAESSMTAFQESMTEYKSQLAKGVIQQAYRGLMDYFWSLKTFFEKKHPDYASGGVYYGFMDMTYIPLFPQKLKKRKLKIAVVFVHETFKFEVWLAGVNKNIQAKYWELIKVSGFSKYRLPTTKKGADSIVEHVLAENPDFGDLDALTRQIEKGTLMFIKDIEGFLSEHGV